LVDLGKKRNDEGKKKDKSATRGKNTFQGEWGQGKKGKAKRSRGILVGAGAVRG